jgi:ABC-2 type transport system permease protein
MAMLGATVTDAQESGQVSGIVILPMTIPFYFVTAFMEHPNGVLSKVLSYFPLSSPVATTMRMAFTNLPTIEIVAIFVGEVLFAIFSVWMAGKAFKAGMLHYSRRLKLKDIFRKEASHA